ncbi:MAG: hypothetical protein AAF415_19540, partial [Pseudomonadota bacterium]
MTFRAPAGRRKDAMQALHAAPGKEFESFADFYQNSVYASFPQEHRSGGSFGLNIFRAHQEPVDFIDAAVQDMVFTRTDDDIGDVLIDIGDGAQISGGCPGTFAYYPAGTLDYPPEIGPPTGIDLSRNWRISDGWITS